MKRQVKADACPCGGGDYATCCGVYHHDYQAGAAADSAERLMRSRYSAYVLGLTEYVVATWHASTRPALDELAHDAGSKWLGLAVKRHEANGDSATVEFVARYKLDGRAHRLHEISRFVREEGRWFYVDGSFPERRTTT